MAKKLHEYFNLVKPVNCTTCNSEITNIYKCKVQINPKAIKDKPLYEVDIDENDVEYICLDCCDKTKPHHNTF